MCDIGALKGISSVCLLGVLNLLREHTIQNCIHVNFRVFGKGLSVFSDN